MVPHMNMGGSTDMGTVEYADHEVQSLNVRTRVNGSDSVDAIANVDPVSQRGIDSDEVAELVAMYRDANLVGSFGEQNQSQANDVIAEGALGINLSPDELPNRSGAIGTDVVGDADTIIISGEEGGEVNLTNFEEPGLLDSHSASGSTSFLGSTNDEGAGGTGVENSNSRFINFRKEFGSGPYLDRTDDISIHNEVTALNLVDQVNVDYEVKYQLYWKVDELPEGRANFQRP